MPISRLHRRCASHVVYLVGLPEGNAKTLIQDLRAELGQVPIITPDSFGSEDIAEELGPIGNGMLTTVPGIPRSVLPPAGKKFLREFGRAGALPGRKEHPKPPRPPRSCSTRSRGRTGRAPRSSRSCSRRRSRTASSARSPSIVWVTSILRRWACTATRTGNRRRRRCACTARPREWVATPCRSQERFRGRRQTSHRGRCGLDRA